jgi:5'-3' exonuclease
MRTLDTTTIDPRLATESEIHEFIQNQKQDLDFSKIDINSVEFQALPISLQHEIILDLKNKSRTPSQYRVDQMLQNSKTALDFSKSQIKNVIHRHTLTDRYHQTLKNNVVQKRVAGVRQKEFVLIKKEGSGWEMSAKEEKAKVVVDLTGLEGFQGEASKVDSIEGIGMEDYVDDNVPFEAILEKIQQQPVLIIDDDRQAQTQDQEMRPVLDLGCHLYPSIWARNWKNSRPDHFDRIYPNFEELLGTDILSKSVESLEELRGLLLKRIEDSADDEKSIHVFFLEFIESSMLMKERLVHDNGEIEMTPENTLPNSTTPRKRLVIESESDDEIYVQPKRPSLDPVSLPIEPITSIPEIVQTISSPIRDQIPNHFLEISIFNDAPSHSPEKDTPKENPEDPVVISSDSDNEEWEAIPVMKEVVVREKDDQLNMELEPKILEEEFGTIYDPFSQPAVYTPTKPRRDSISSDVEVQPIVLEDDVNYIDVPILLDNEVDEYYSDLKAMDLNALRKQTHAEVVDLIQEHRSNMRDNAEVTPQMIIETQELLKHFGIPYMTAPMEAESQCAYLLMKNLVDGIITDDSDVFLFGGTLVYKNLFDSKRYVERFTLDGIRELGLDRSQLIQMAFLLGSDYTTGIHGIGPVSGVEVVTNWKADGLDGLVQFKEWVMALQKGTLSDEEQKRVPKKLLSQCRKIEFPDAFPDVRIYDAYMNPTIDDSLLPFVWGEPQLDPIRDYLKAKLHWTVEKIDSVVIPVIKELRQQKKPRQTQLEDFFPVTPKKHKSVRVQNATRGGRNSKKKRNM